jgi:SNF2 family DNA or RNA helicase
VHKLVCGGTLEERIAQVIDEKRALAGRVIETAGGSESWVTELGDGELEELIGLGSAMPLEVGGA